jgi:hypothetical protein
MDLASTTQPVDGERTILFFCIIAPYKGLEYLITAVQQVQSRHDDYRSCQPSSLILAEPFLNPEALGASPDAKASS